jgi:hypothetical protein
MTTTISMAQQPLVCQGLVIEDSRSHTETPQSVGRLWTSDQTEAETTHNTYNRQTSMSSGGIGNCSPSKREAGGPRLRRRGHWEQQQQQQQQQQQ